MSHADAGEVVTAVNVAIAVNVGALSKLGEDPTLW